MIRRNPALLTSVAVPALLLAAIAWGPAGPDPGAATPSGSGPGAPSAIAAVAADPAVARALEAVDARRGELVEAWIRLAGTPASSGQETARAVLVEAWMKEAGLEAVRRDAAGNVLGVLPGRDRAAKRTVFMAHMDTVAKPGADFTIRRGGGRLHGPGVRDDSSGVAGLLAAARLAREAGVVPPADVWIVASVEEEIGLRGSKAFLDAEGSRVGAFVAVDGFLGQISYAATSIFWMKLHFKAPGSHTLKSHESPSTTRAVALAIEGVYAIDVPRHPEDLESWINVGMLGGGEVPNAQARDAWFTVDLRSNDPRTQAALEAKILDACRKAAADVGVTFEKEDLQRLDGAHLPDHRDSQIVRAARDVLDHLEWGRTVLTPRGTADHNIAILRGIPAIALGVTTGDGAHTPTEHADIAPYPIGVKQLILLMAMPLR